MRTFLECIPCFLRQTLDALRRTTSDEGQWEKVLRSILEEASKMDLRRSPPAMGQVIHKHIREATGNSDPYREVKERQNRFALALLPALALRVEKASDPFGVALRLAAAGNVIDLGVKSGIAEGEISRVIEDSLSAPLDGAAVERLRAAARAAKRILYIGDNAGEIVLDRLLVEQLGASRVTFAVRGAPVINDATIADAEASGMAALVEVVDSGSDAPGTILEDCSRSFRERFNGADLVLSKGQGNFETLSDVEAPIFFLLKAKCAVVSEHLGCLPGDLMLVEGSGRRAAPPRAPADEERVKRR